MLLYFVCLTPLHLFVNTLSLLLALLLFLTSLISAWAGMAYAGGKWPKFTVLTSGPCIRGSVHVLCPRVQLLTKQFQRKQARPWSYGLGLEIGRMLGIAFKICQKLFLGLGPWKFLYLMDRVELGKTLGLEPFQVEAPDGVSPRCPAVHLHTEQQQDHLPPARFTHT